MPRIIRNIVTPMIAVADAGTKLLRRLHELVGKLARKPDARYGFSRHPRASSAVAAAKAATATSAVTASDSQREDS